MNVAAERSGTGNCRVAAPATVNRMLQLAALEVKNAEPKHLPPGFSRAQSLVMN